jgi:hypothetical protein
MGSFEKNLEKLREGYHQEKPETSDVFVGAEKGAMYEQSEERPGDAPFAGWEEAINRLDAEEEAHNTQLIKMEKFIENKELALESPLPPSTDENYAVFVEEGLRDLRRAQGDLEDFREKLIDRKATYQKYNRTLASSYMENVDLQLKKTDELIVRTGACIEGFERERTRQIIG